MSRQGAWRDERGFTLVEVLIVVVIMGIVLAIATSSWFGAIESRKADAATNQVASDLRLVHTKATARLDDYSFVIPSPTSTTYQTGLASGTPVSTSMPAGAQIVVPSATTETNIKFKADGSAQVMSGPSPVNGTITLTAGSSKTPSKSHTIQINITTSRIKVVP